MLSRVPERETKLEVATSSLPSKRHRSGRSRNLTPVFLVVPKRGDKIKSANTTSAYSGAKTWRNCYVSLTFLGVPKGGQIGNGYITTAFLGSQRGQNCYRTPVSQSLDRMNNSGISRVFSPPSPDTREMGQCWVAPPNPTETCGRQEEAPNTSTTRSASVVS